jgi:hypothetical protein
MNRKKPLLPLLLLPPPLLPKGYGLLIIDVVVRVI